ncbi:MAG TPA: PadR family transcriptional regulator [Anaerolineales bacterium]|nr:PadR family transcriptional regulator [Anaerolineales bacterium]
MSPTVDQDLRQAFVRLHILYHAAQGPVYGVELMHELGEHGYRLGPGTLYPALHDFEQRGLLTRREAVVDGRRRKYYVATRAGRRLLRQARGMVTEWLEELSGES